MLIAEVIDIYRDRQSSSGKIIGYRIKSVSGEERDVDALQLKTAIRNKRVELKNYKLTSDNRLIKSRHFDLDRDAYYLMNKDVIVGKFNEFTGERLVTGKLPFGFNEFNSWVESRATFSCVRDAKKFFSSIGINEMNEFIEVTHCVSLHDTFWVKRVDSKLNWNNVSPFRNDYSDIISAYALEGVYIGKGNGNYFSPVIGTSGSFPHTWKFNGGDITFLKAGSKYTLCCANSGREPYSEYYASKIAEFLGFKHVKYDIRTHLRNDNRVDIITECKCYTTERIGSVPAHLLGLNTYEEVIEYCKKFSLEAYKTILDMLFMDCLLLNTDRHLGNIEFLVDNERLEVIGVAPIFDNNFALVPNFMEGYDKFNRSEYLARDGRTFENLYQLVRKNRSYNSELIKLKSSKFEKPVKVEIKESRLKFLNNFLQMQAEYLLKLGK